VSAPAARNGGNAPLLVRPATPAATEIACWSRGSTLRGVGAVPQEGAGPRTLSPPAAAR